MLSSIRVRTLTGHQTPGQSQGLRVRVRVRVRVGVGVGIMARLSVGLSHTYSSLPFVRS